VVACTIESMTWIKVTVADVGTDGTSDVMAEPSHLIRLGGAGRLLLNGGASGLATLLLLLLRRLRLSLSLGNSKGRRAGRTNRMVKGRHGGILRHPQPGFTYAAEVTLQYAPPHPPRRSGPPPAPALG
jgi:hypothetical protein